MKYSNSSLLNTRVTLLITHNNDTEGNSELIDIRTGSDGSVFETAGQAVRTQMNDLNNRIGNLTSMTGKIYQDTTDAIGDIQYLLDFDGYNLADENRFVSGILSGVDGSVSADNGYFTSDFINIRLFRGKTLYLKKETGELSGAQRVVEYNADKEIIRSVGTWINNFTVSDNAVYIRATWIGALANNPGKMITWNADAPYARYNPNPYSLPFKKQNTNLANPDEIVYGMLQSDGTVGNSQDYCTTGYIDVKQLRGKSLYMHSSDSNLVSFHSICYYNSDKVGQGWYGFWLSSSTVPSSACYARITYFSDAPCSLGIHIGTDRNASYRKYTTAPYNIPDNVFLTIPSALRVASGIESNIYYRNIIRGIDPQICSAINVRGKYNFHNTFARYTPDSASDGSVTISFRESNNNDIIAQAVCSVHSVPASAGAGETKKILIIGDSLTDADISGLELCRLFDNDVMNVEFLGSMVNSSLSETFTVRNEGRSQWRAYTYAFCQNGSQDNLTNNVENPFYNPQTGQFDFSYYMQQQNYDDVDYVFICLGTNDLQGSSKNTRKAMIEAWNTIISSIHSFDGSIRIGVWLPPTRALYDNCSNIDIDNALVANHYLLEEYDNRESEKIYIVPAGLNVDPYNDYPYENAAISRRNTNIYEKICTDKVHPANSGYFKIADVLYSYIKFFAELDEE